MTQELLNRAKSLVAQGHWAQAQTVLEGLLDRHPQDVEALLRLCDVHLAQRHNNAARKTVLMAQAMPPRQAKFLLPLMQRLRLLNEIDSLRESLQQLPPPRQLPIPMLLELASLHSMLGEQRQALALVDEAVLGDPDFPPTLLNRAQILGYLGRFEEANAALHRCIARAPEIARAHWLLARHRRATDADNHVSLLKRQLAAAPGPADHAMLTYALHKELDDLGDFDASWAALERACTAKRSTIDYRSADTQQLVDAMISCCSADFVASTSPTPAAATPIFIVGMHRTGTTLLERILGGHAGIVDAGELYDFTSAMRQAADHHCRGVIDEPIVARAPSLNFSAIGQRYLASSHWRTRGKPFFTDKLPSNFLQLGFIAKALPQARILHMVRDPMDTCLSNLRELFSDACPYSYEQIELADYFLQYQRLMAHWHTVLPGRILDVRYADLVQEPETTTRKVMAFLGLDFAGESLAVELRAGAVSTASNVQVRQPINRHSLGSWRRYEQQLAPLRARLSEPVT